MRVVYPVLGLLVLLGAWWAGVAVFQPQPIVLPAPVLVWDSFREHTAYLLDMAWVSTQEIGAGFAFATVLGVLGGIWLFGSRTADRMFSPILVAVNAVPKIALAPLLMVWLGLTWQSRITMVMLLCFFPIVLGTIAGLRSTPSEVVELARSLRATRLQTFARFRLPGALPQLFVGLRVAMPLAAVGSTIGEMVGGDSGLGFVVSTASGSSDMALTFAALLLLALVSVLLYFAIELLEKLLLPWQRATTA